MPIPETLAELAVPIKDLVPYGRNPRRGDVSKIAESLEVNGQYRPIVVRRGTNEVLAGNHTLAAATKLGWTKIAATWVECDDDEAKRIVLVDNQTSDLATNDDATLAALLESLGTGNLAGTGFGDNDLSALLQGLAGAPVALTDPDEAPKVEKEAVSVAGDVWTLGPHRLLCGDSTDMGMVADMMAGELADAVWTDPPYGVSYVGGTSDALTIQNDGADDLPELLGGAFRTVAAVSRPGAPIYVAHADTARIVFEQSMLAAGLIVRQNLIWVKNALVLGRSDYHYKHEPILDAVAPPAEGDGGDDEGVSTHEPLLYGFTSGGKGRLGRGGERWFGDNKQSTVFQVAKPPKNADHPTMKPVALITAMLSNSCPRGGVVLDLFGGSGSTLIAAHQLGMRARLVELDPRYADVICRRYQAHTGIVPSRGGEPHDFLAES